MSFLSIVAHTEMTTSPKTPFDAKKIFSSIPEAVADLAVGKLVVVVDDADRENEGDLVAIAEKCTPETINFMATHSRGLICTPISGDRLDALEIDQMVSVNTDTHGTAFSVTVDVDTNSTGISAADRSDTIQALINPSSKPEDFRRPGHTFPLRYTEGGVLRRAGHTEAAVDLALLANCSPAGVICEIMGDDGTMARLPELVEFCEKHGLRIISIADLIHYRRQSEKLVRRVVETRIPTEYGEFRCVGYESSIDGTEHVAFVKGDVSGEDDVLVRVHAEYFIGDILGYRENDSRSLLRAAMRCIAESGKGVLLYFRRYDGKDISVVDELSSFKGQRSKNYMRMDDRDYGIGAQILVDLGVTSMCLLSNHPATRRVGLAGYGLSVTETLSLAGEKKPPKRQAFADLLEGLSEADLLRVDRE